MNRVHRNPLWFSKRIDHLKPHLLKDQIEWKLEVKQTTQEGWNYNFKIHNEDVLLLYIVSGSFVFISRVTQPHKKPWPSNSSAETTPQKPVNKHLLKCSQFPSTSLQYRFSIFSNNLLSRQPHGLKQMRIWPKIKNNNPIQPFDSLNILFNVISFNNLHQ